MSEFTQSRNRSTSISAFLLACNPVRRSACSSHGGGATVMRAKSLLAALVVAVVVTSAAASAQAKASRLITRPVAETFGTHTGYGYTGIGVNTSTGNYTTSDTDLDFPVGLLHWTRTYNSLDPTVGTLGPCWMPSMRAHLVVTDDGSVAFHDDDGRVLTFTPDGTGGYQRAPDLVADLTRDPTRAFSLRHPSGEVWSFDANGRGTERTHDGERLGFTYDDAGRLATAAHSSGHTV